MPVTMKDVAELAGVSQPTVSAVLSGTNTSIRFSPATRERVLDAAGILNYRLNAAARTLARPRSKSLGLLLTSATTGRWANPYFGQILDAFERACRKFGYNMQLCCCSVDEMDGALQSSPIEEQAVDGVVATGYLSRQMVERLERFRLPVVGLGDALRRRRKTHL